jgi:cytochrome P450
MPQQTSAADAIDIADLFKSESPVKGCPFAHFSKLREMKGLYYSPEVDAYLITRYADAVEVFADSARFSNKIPFGRVAMHKERDAIQALTSTDPELQGLMAALRPRRIPMLSSADPPVHKRQRRLVQTAFAPKRLNKAEPWIRKTAEELIDAFPQGQVVDIVASLTIPLPVRAIAILLGVESSQQERFKRWSDNFFFAASEGTSDPAHINAALHGQAELFAYIADQVAAHRQEPQDDIISDVLEASEKTEDPLSVAEMQAMFSQLLVAGNETTTGLLGSCLLVLAKRRDLFAALVDHPELIPKFIDEILRREFPVAANFRTVKCNTAVGGFPVEEGAQLMILQGAVNNDPAVFGSDDLNEEFAAHGRHVVFGHGIHFCVGAPLAKLEAKIVIDVITQRFSDVELDTNAPLRYAPFYMNRALAFLPLRLTQRPSRRVCEGQ